MHYKAAMLLKVIYYGGSNLILDILNNNYLSLNSKWLDLVSDN
jgi:hypothetical protein